MEINFDIFKKAEKAGAQVVVVTKYFDTKTTHQILEKIKNEKSFLTLGENRIEQLMEKNLPPENIHFIGNLQSRKLKEIAAHSSAIHSLCNLKHAQILSSLCEGNLGDFPKKIDVFIQINISQEPQKIGVSPKEFPQFLKAIQKLKNLNILGISNMGAGEFTESKKRKEFQDLRSLRDQYLPNGKISAGTSRDYEIALEEGIEIVRIGQALFKL